MSSGRKAGQFGFADALVAVRAGSDRLGRLGSVVKWYRFEKVLKPLSSESLTGRPAYAPLMLFKALFLQRLYGLRVLELEEALHDRLSFRRFCGLGLEQTAPDHTTLCRFRNRLVEAGILERLFCELDRQLDAAGLILRRGMMLDATVIETEAAAHPPREGNGIAGALHDKDAAFTHKKGKAVRAMATRPTTGSTRALASSGG